MPDTRIVKSGQQLTALGFKIGQMGLRNWFFPENDKHRYLAMNARWWEPHYTANDISNNKVNKWHITFEEVAADYRKTGARPALHWEYSSATDMYACKGWKNGRPLNVATTHITVQEKVTVPITADADLGELPIGLSYMSEDDFQAATTGTISKQVATPAQAFLERITNNYLKKPRQWFGPNIAAPVWNAYEA